MFRWLLILFSVLVFALMACAGAADQWTSAEYLPGRLIIDFAPSVSPHVPAIDRSGIAQIGIPSLDALFADVGAWDVYREVPDGILARLKTPPDLYRTYVLVFRAEHPVLDVLERFAADPYVKDVQPDLLCRVYRTPNDALWSSQWDKRLIGADVVWDVSTGDSSIIVAAIDTGVDWNHPDIGLDPSHPERGTVLWVNPGEDLNSNRLPYSSPDVIGDAADINGIDDEGDGKVDDFIGWDFIQSVSGCWPGEDCAGQDNNPFGMEDHGTHTSGIMTAHGNNEIGVTGVNWGARMMALRAGYKGSDGNGWMPESASNPAIYYAAANGAKVLNMSYGSSQFSQASQTACNAAWNQGCVLFGASGNDGSTAPHYPGGNANVIAVNATNSSDELATWSDRGTWTDICAPGADPGVWSTIIDVYGGPSWQGTSMASPNAAGVAALLWGIFPTMTNAEIRDLVINTAEDITAQNPGIPPDQLHGRVSASNALASLYPRLSVTGTQVTDDSPGDGDHRLENGETASVVFTFTNDPAWSQATGISVTVSTPDPRLTITNASFDLGDIAPGQSANNQADPVSISASGVVGAFWGQLLFAITSPSGYHATDTTLIRVGRGQLLLVDDDVTTNYQSFYDTALVHLNLNPDMWSTSVDGPLPTTEMAAYSTILWECGNDSTNTLTTDDQTALTQFLNGGGNLMLVGQNIPEDIGSTTFHTDYLHAQNENLDGNRQLNGIAGNPISDGRNLLLIGGGCAGNGTLSPSRIIPINGGEAVYDYTLGGIGGVMYSGAYKTAYFSFALEAACGLAGSAHHQAVIAAVLNWFGILSVPPSPSDHSIPTVLALSGSYPNPFNPSTTINFDVPASSHVTLKVFDVLGREVATLVDGQISAGSYHASFDGSNLASGIYLARLTSGSSSLSSKLVLMK
jgi:subtilisin family serine protease